MVKRNIVDEKELSKSMYLMDLLLEAGLERNVLHLRPFYPQLIRKFIVNLTSNFDDPASIEF